jgi:hypothetical protein
VQESPRGGSKKVRAGRSFRSRGVQRGEIDGQDSQGRLAKSRQPPNLGEVVQDLHLRRKEEPRAIGIQLIGVCGDRSFVPVEIMICDFPTQMEC